MDLHETTETATTESKDDTEKKQQLSSDLRQQGGDSDVRDDGGAFSGADITDVERDSLREEIQDAEVASSITQDSANIGPLQVHNDDSKLQLSDTMTRRKEIEHKIALQDQDGKIKALEQSLEEASETVGKTEEFLKDEKLNAQSKEQEIQQLGGLLEGAKNENVQNAENIQQLAPVKESAGPGIAIYQQITFDDTNQLPNMRRLKADLEIRLQKAKDEENHDLCRALMDEIESKGAEIQEISEMSQDSTGIDILQTENDALKLQLSDINASEKEIQYKIKLQEKDAQIKSLEQSLQEASEKVVQTEELLKHEKLNVQTMEQRIILLQPSLEELINENIQKEEKICQLTQELTDVKENASSGTQAIDVSIESLKQEYTSILDTMDSSLSSYSVLITAEAKIGARRSYIVLGFLLIICVAILFLFGRIALTNLIGFVYPCYTSYKVLTSGSFEGSRQWISYWFVYGIFVCVESFVSIATHYLSLYCWFKTGFLIWCMVNHAQGAEKVHSFVICPLLARIQIGDNVHWNGTTWVKQT